MSPQNETARIVNQIERMYEGDSWHGDNVVAVLSDVTAEESVARPVSNAHTIRELVDHMTVWLDAVSRRIEGEAWQPKDASDDWPPTSGTDDAAWQGAREALGQAQARLRRIISALPVDRLDEPPIPDYSPAYVQAHGAVQHTLYHLGQVALLKKALRR